MISFREAIKCPSCSHKQFALVFCEENSDGTEAIRETQCTNCDTLIDENSWDFINYSELQEQEKLAERV